MDLELRRTVRANALFSLGTGVLLAVIPDTVGDWLGADIDGWMRLLGFALIGHSAMLWWAQDRDDLRRWARFNLAAIAPYPLLMIGVVTTGLIDGSTGRTLVVMDGLIVGALAWGHWRELRTPAP